MLIMRTINIASIKLIILIEATDKSKDKIIVYIKAVEKAYICNGTSLVTVRISW